MNYKKFFTSLVKKLKKIFSPKATSAVTAVVVDVESPPLVTTTSSGISSASDGRVTPSFDLQGVAKGGKTGKDGREKGAVAYCAAEHIALLFTYTTAVPDSFNASEFFDEWKMVCKAMAQGYYMNLGLLPHKSITLQSHFVDHG